MMKRNLTGAGSFLPIIPAIFFVFLSCAGASSNQPGESRLVGGPCQYKSYPGQATILSVSRSQTGNQETIERFDVLFSFKPQRRVEESFARDAAKKFHLYGNNFQYPDREFLQVNNLRAGSVLEGSMKVIISGTCTPVLFDFPALKH